MPNSKNSNIVMNFLKLIIMMLIKFVKKIMLMHLIHFSKDAKHTIDILKLSKNYNIRNKY